MKRIVLSILVVISLVASGIVFAPHTKAAPATFTVTNTDDSGPGSLRQAIIDANGNGNAADVDVIEFAIAGSGVHTITPASLFEQIVEPVIIDGYSQPGSSENTAIAPNPLNGTITVEIDGGGTQTVGLYFGTGADGSIIQGLSVNGFTDQNIRLEGDNYGVYGNYLGVEPDGLTPNAVSQTGLRVNTGSGSNIGGSLAAKRNVIAGYASQTLGLQMNGSNATVYGNYIGLGKDGVTDLGTILPAGLTGNGNVVGGPATGQMNVISGGETVNLTVLSNQNIVQSNYIGTDYTGQKNAAISNGSGIIITTTASENLVGGSSTNEGNKIIDVKGSAISVVAIDIVEGPFTLNPAKNAFLRNTIADIGILSLPKFGRSNLGIDFLTNIDTSAPPDFNPDDFAEQGPTANDDADADTGPNDFINKPVLKTAQQVDDQLTITYDLTSAGSPSNAYRIEFYANDNSSIFGAGPGEEYLGAISSTGTGTDKSVTLTVSGNYADKALTSTVTAIDGATTSGFGATSEFSQNISIGSATDFDSDGAADAVENLAPNNGDGNNDGTLDRLQPTVTTYEIDSTGIYATLVTTGCSENGTVASVDVSSLAKTDAGKSYPYGLVDFTLNCSRGDTVNVVKYVFVDDQPESYSLRKFNPVTEEYTDISGSTINSQLVGEATALVSTYAITDGGEYDDDGEANGIIVDPVGLATTASLADTGMNIWLYLLGIIGVLGFGMYLLHCRLQLRSYR